MPAIAAAIGRRFGLPVQSIPAEAAVTHFGGLATLAGFDMPASGALTREKLGWTPTRPGLIADIDWTRLPADFRRLPR